MAQAQAWFGDQCASCHGAGDSPGDGLAPSLKGVYGRKIAGLPDFAYSDALKAKEGVWDDQTLDAFLADPQTNVPGTAMFGSAPDPVQRHAIIELLKTLK